MEMGAGQQWARTPWPDTRLGGSGAVRQNGTLYCRVPSSGSPGRTVHSPRSRGPLLLYALAAAAWQKGVWAPGQQLAGYTEEWWKQGPGQHPRWGLLGPELWRAALEG